MWQKGYSAILLSFYLLGALHPEELAKLPHLFRHYQLHHRQDQMNLWAFFCHHYAKGNQEEVADFKEDMKLPFKIPQHCIFLTGLFIMQPKAYQPLGRAELFPLPLIIKGDTKKNSNFLDSIWQPPRYQAS